MYNPQTNLVYRARDALFTELNAMVGATFLPRGGPVNPPMTGDSVPVVFKQVVQATAGPDSEATITVRASVPATESESGQQAPARLPSVEGAEPSVVDSPVQETVQEQTLTQDPAGEGESEVNVPVPSKSVVPVVETPTIETQETEEREPRRSTRERRQPERFVALVESKEEPILYKEARETPEATKWHAACVEEMAAQEQNRSWSLTYLPQGRRAIRNRWVFKRKTDSQGKIERYRAGLVAKGFSQVEGVDFNETFAPVVRQESIRLLMSIAAHKNLVAKQWDVKTAFLYGSLNEELYMMQPEGFKDTKNPSLVCKLNKAIYGLKQASRQWHAKLSQVLLQYGFSQCRKDESIFVFRQGKKKMYLAVYVDNIFVFK